jgi:ADP-ribose pyrophosphatase YjhB (NUDIX family)
MEPNHAVVCDHTSVGILVRQKGKLLLIERKKPPHGFAPPAGHVDERASFEAAAVAELYEEVGLTVIALTLIESGRKNNPCRRPNGTWHFWRIYQAEVTGEVKESHEEVKKILWCSRLELNNLADRTRMYKLGKVLEDDWEARPGLEPVWLEWLEKIGEVDLGR